MGMGHRDPAKRQQRLAQRQPELKERLKITPAQEPAWTALTTAMKLAANAMQNRHAQHAELQELQKLPTPERLDKMRHQGFLCAAQP
ncbi:MAG: Spy/CpxP family protein refolding chaperone [Polaromonas sp.]|nr:Spy/CpxP family protein refolding chaperone [Polaromonas sp.]